LRSGTEKRQIKEKNCIKEFLTEKSCAVGLGLLKNLSLKENWKRTRRAQRLPLT